MILLLGNKIKGGIGSVMADRYVKSDNTKKILYIDANNSYAHSMSQPKPYDEIKFDRNVKLEDILNTLDDSDIGYLVEVDIKYPRKMKEKTKNFLFCPENKKIDSDIFTQYMNENKSNTHKLRIFYVIALIKGII